MPTKEGVAMRTVCTCPDFGLSIFARAKVENERRICVDWQTVRTMERGLIKFPSLASKFMRVVRATKIKVCYKNLVL